LVVLNGDLAKGFKSVEIYWH